MRQKLSQSDVQLLLTDPSAEGRERTATKIAMEYSSEGISDSERQIAEDIFRLLLHDAEQRVREALSLNLKDFKGLSHDIALALANDVEKVSLPMLRFSTVLTDEDLIDIVCNQGPAKQNAVAGREQVSEALADALVETHNEEVVSTLVSNEGADISETAMQKVVDEFGTVERINKPLAMRAKLPVSVSERLVHLVSESMREHLVTNHDLPPGLASDLILQSRERATLSLVSQGSDSADLGELVHHLNENGRLTHTILLRAICMGDLDFFEHGVAELAGVPCKSASTLINDDGPLGLHAIMERAKLPYALYPAFSAAVEAAHETEYDGGENDRARFRRRMIERILTHVENPDAEMGKDNIEYLFDKLSQIEPGVLSIFPQEPESEASAG